MRTAYARLREVDRPTASGNATAGRLLRGINERIRVLRIHDFTIDARIGATIGEHLEIVAIILSGDADAAAAFMRAHVQRSALVVRDRVGQALTRMFDAGAAAAGVTGQGRPGAT